MKTRFFSIAAIFVLLISNTQTADAQFLRGLLKLCGVSDDSPWMQVADVGDQIGNAYIARKTDNAVNTYGSDKASDYNNWANDWNAKEQKKLDDYNNEVDQFKIDYCKQYGFYDSWVSKYGDEWYEKAGRAWFDERNNYAKEKALNNKYGYNRDNISYEAIQETRMEADLLPWHLRGDAAEETRYNPVNSSLSSVVLNTIGLSSSDAERGKQWSESNKYGKANIALDYAADVAGAFVKDDSALRAFKDIAKANVNYLNNKENKNPEAITQRNIDLLNVVFDAASVQKEKKAQLLREKKQISEVLKNNGYSDDEQALEVAGTILAIQKDESMSDSQKKEWLCQLGYYGQEEELLNVANQVNENLIVEKPEPPKAKPVNQDSINRAKQLALEKKIREEAIEKVNSTKIDSYAFDATDLTTEQMSQLDAIAETLNKYSDLAIEIIGNTCEIGYKRVNERVGLRRADAAKNYLVEKGVNADRITTNSNGEQNPVVDNTSKENRKINRRLEFIIK